jgi:uncharacterized protein YegP (UPF0339 family)
VFHYQVYKGTNGQWRWRYVSSNGRIIADSAEAYHNKADCLHGIALMKGSSNSPVYES